MKRFALSLILLAVLLTSAVPQVVTAAPSEAAPWMAPLRTAGPIYHAPMFSSPVAGQALAGRIVTVYAQSGNWYYIRYNYRPATPDTGPGYYWGWVPKSMLVISGQ